MLYSAPLLALSLVAPSHAAPLPAYTYSRPEAADPAVLEGYAFATWPVRASLYAAAADVAVLDAPGGKRTFVLGFGDSVRVEDVGAVGRVGDRVDRWYRVSGAQSGWVFGGDLTPYRWEADFDGDGEKELATVAWMDDFSVRVRIFEPNLRAGAMMPLDLESAGGAYLSQRGASVEAELVPASKAGIPLVHVHVGVEACADYRDDWISYQSPAAVRIGSERVALSLSGLADPPSVSSFEVEFSAKRKTAYVTRTSTSGEAGSQPVVENERYVLRDGVFRQEKDGTVER
jgi:hypothetical protein